MKSGILPLVLLVVSSITRSLHAGEIYLPLEHKGAKTPETRSLTSDEANRAMDDPDFPGIEKLPIRPRVKTAPSIERP